VRCSLYSRRSWLGQDPHPHQAIEATEERHSEFADRRQPVHERQ
jgi:hypothetical protein